jgi:hypothetical protein
VPDDIREMLGIASNSPDAHDACPGMSRETRSAIALVLLLVGIPVGIAVVGWHDAAWHPARQDSWFQGHLFSVLYGIGLILFGTVIYAAVLNLGDYAFFFHEEKGRVWSNLDLAGLVPLYALAAILYGSVTLVYVTNGIAVGVLAAALLGWRCFRRRRAAGQVEC